MSGAPASSTPLMSACHRGRLDAAKALLIYPAVQLHERRRGDADSDCSGGSTAASSSSNCSSSTASTWTPGHPRTGLRSRTEARHGKVRGDHGAGIYPEDVLKFYGATEYGSGSEALGIRSPSRSFDPAAEDFSRDRGSYRVPRVTVRNLVSSLAPREPSRGSRIARHAGSAAASAPLRAAYASSVASTPASRLYLLDAVFVQPRAVGSAGVGNPRAGTASPVPSVRDCTGAAARAAAEGRPRVDWTPPPPWRETETDATLGARDRARRARRLASASPRWPSRAPPCLSSSAVFRSRRAAHHAHVAHFLDAHRDAKRRLAETASGGGVDGDARSAVRGVGSRDRCSSLRVRRRPSRRTVHGAEHASPGGPPSARLRLVRASVFLFGDAFLGGVERGRRRVFALLRQLLLRVRLRRVAGSSASIGTIASSAVRPPRGYSRARRWRVARIWRVRADHRSGVRADGDPRLRLFAACEAPSHAVGVAAARRAPDGSPRRRVPRARGSKIDACLPSPGGCRPSRRCATILSSIPCSDCGAEGDNSACTSSLSADTARGRRSPTCVARPEKHREIRTVAAHRQEPRRWPGPRRSPSRDRRASPRARLRDAGHPGCNNASLANPAPARAPGVAVFESQTRLGTASLAALKRARLLAE